MRLLPVPGRRAPHHEDVLRPVQDAPGRVVRAVPPYRVPVRPQDVAYDHGAQEQRPREVQGDRQVVALGGRPCLWSVVTYTRYIQMPRK